jgi:hypothetical protein
MRKFKRYKENLSVIEFEGSDYVLSYTTRVAKIDYKNGTLLQIPNPKNLSGKWSMTTQKHINYVASEYRLDLIKN